MATVHPILLFHRRRSSWDQRVAWALVVASILVGLLAGCSSEPPRRQPDVPALLGELDRIEGGIVTHEIAVARWRAQR